MSRVLSVGQCGMDHRSIEQSLRNHFDVEVVAAATEAESLELIRKRPFDLVLVNRQFDEDGTEGIEFIRRLKADPELSTVPVMLITNFPEYADQAVTLGAARGFGKAELGSSDFLARLRPYLGGEK